MSDSPTKAPEPQKSSALRWISLALLMALGAAAFLVRNAWVHREKEPDAPPSYVPMTWGDVNGTPGHKAHVGKKHGDKDVECTSCHSGGDAGFSKPAADVCATCHKDEVKKTHLGAPTKGDDAADAGISQATTCLTCHSFAKPAENCITCHEKKIPREGAGHTGDLAAITMHNTPEAMCASCHNPHRDPVAKNADCKGCHAKESTFAHGKMQPLTQSPTDMWLDGGTISACVGDAGDASADCSKPTGGTVPSSGKHAEGACVDCHSPHKKAAEATATCATCHKDKPATATFSLSKPKELADGGVTVTGHNTCATCHQPHTFQKNAVEGCASCHKDHAGATGTAAHSCVGCHDPHDARAPKDCSSCHKETHAFSSQKVPAHAACVSCHAPHNPTGAPPADSCAKCHNKVSLTHTGKPGGKGERCIDCHVPHAEDAKVSLTSAHNTARACSDCHTKASGDHAFHNSNAPGNPNVPGLSPGNSTLACASCHTPHSFNLSGQVPTVCAKCHSAQESVAVASKGHKDCAKCHGTVHEPHKSAPCGSCHAPEATTVPQGHAKCEGCHVAHDGSQKPSAKCSNCHAKEAASGHAKVDGGCATCHRPHGPNGVASPPACATCHKALGGMHRVQTKAGALAHGTCNTCHAQHGPPKADRASCTKCHTDKKTHQPEATSCNGCHVFRE